MIKNKPLTVLVVDDTAIFRKVISDVLTELPGVEVVGIAHNGKIALDKIASLEPDLLTLDIEMPEMSGIEVLKYLKKEGVNTEAIMLSSLTDAGSDMTINALELGAFDFITKPQGRTLEENKEAVKDSIAPILKAFARQKAIKKTLRIKPLLIKEKGVSPEKEDKKVPVTDTKKSKTSRLKRGKAQLVAIGISTGGPNALATMLPEIPHDIGVPILIVQHMPPVFTQSLAKSLNMKCSIEVKEAVNGESLRPNTAFIAPGGKQMKIIAGADGKKRIIKITDDPPENGCKPSADYLFRSVSHHYIGRATGVIMTGMGVDGTEGLKLMYKNGSTIIAQDQESSVVFGMPKEPVKAGIVDRVASLKNIAGEISKTVARKQVKN